jgi:glycosyltransferase involved in cell wall biosynthesis
MAAPVSRTGLRPLTPVMAPAPVLALQDLETILVAIPALNEERFIGSVVHEIRILGFECLVIDDGSTDRTATIAAAAGAIVERHERNAGKAAALESAFEAARIRGTAILVVMDGDWQHDPHEILDLLVPIRAGVADVVTGSRFLPSARGHVPAVRGIGMRLLTMTSSLVSGQSMTDSLSGFRAFGREAIEHFSFQSQGFSAEFEMQFLGQQYGLRHAEVPITARYDDPPKRNVLSYGLHVVNGLIRLAARFRPLLFFGVPSVITLLAGFALGATVVETFERTAQLAAGSALLTVLLILLGSIGVVTAILLHALRGIAVDLDRQMKSLASTVTSTHRPR